MVTAAPTLPRSGDTEVIAGGVTSGEFLRTDTLLPVLLVTAKSEIPSPSTSPIATLRGLVPVVKSTFDANEVLVIEPEVAVFSKTDTVLEPLLATAISGLPSPFKSPK